MPRRVRVECAAVIRVQSRLERLERGRRDVCQFAESLPGGGELLDGVGRSGVVVGEVLHRSIELHQTRFGLINRQQVVVDDALLGNMRPRQPTQPAPMTLRPVAPGIMQAAPQQQLTEAMPTPLQILSRVVPRPHEIAGSFLRRRRWTYLGEQAGPQQLRQLARIAAIRFGVGFKTE